jgi:WhiB family transcriptional regulator, redox-sensing transcriptional regulator
VRGDEIAWREQAACVGTPTEWWFPVDDHGRAVADEVPYEADRLCGVCPVRSECYDHALRSERYGVYAGIHEVRRAALRRAARIRLREDPDWIALDRVIAAARAAAEDEFDDETRSA